MFPSTNIPAEPRSLRRSAARAFGLARAFLLLEDPELDARAAGGAHGFAVEPTHPHRQPLRPDRRPRRPGAGMARPQACLSPLRPEPSRHPARSSRSSLTS